MTTGRLNWSDTGELLVIYRLEAASGCMTHSPELSSLYLLLDHDYHLRWQISGNFCIANGGTGVIGGILLGAERAFVAIRYAIPCTSDFRRHKRSKWSGIDENQRKCLMKLRVSIFTLCTPGFRQGSCRVAAHVRAYFAFNSNHRSAIPRMCCLVVV
jgi:hypothetical protein